VASGKYPAAWAKGIVSECHAASSVSGYKAALIICPSSLVASAAAILLDPSFSNARVFFPRNMKLRDCAS